MHLRNLIGPLSPLRWHLVWDNEVFFHHGKVSFLPLD
jgi:hypothetical protein